MHDYILNDTDAVGLTIVFLFSHYYYNLLMIHGFKYSSPSQPLNTVSAFILAVETTNLGAGKPPRKRQSPTPQSC